MANMKDLNRFVKKGQVKAKKVPVKAGSWLANAMKSVGLSSRDIVQQVMPNTIGAAESAAETVGEITESLRDLKGQRGKLKQAFDANVYTQLAKEGLKNALEDLKTGDFYNKKRFDEYTEKAMNDMGGDFDFGGMDDSGFDEDFDFGDDDEDFDADISSDDGGATATVKKSSKGKNELTQISMVNNIGPDSPLVQTINFGAQVTAKATGVIVDSNNSNAKAIVTLMSNNNMASLKALTQVNDSIVTMHDGLSDIISKHNAVAEQYYADSMGSFNKIIDSLQVLQNNTMVAALANTPKDVENAPNLLDMFNGAVIDKNAYLAFLKKNITRFSEENIFLSYIKSALEQTDAIGSMMAAPLRSITDNLAKQMIPSIVQESMKRFDDMLGSFGVGILSKIGSYQGSSNPIFDAIGKIFGIKNKMETSVDKTKYEKGAVPFDGITHRTINDVIPTYLRQITAALTGKEEFVFDYNKGQYRTLRNVQKQREDDNMYARTAPFSDYINNFNDSLKESFTFATEEDRQNVEKQFVHAIDKLINRGGISTYKRSTRNGETYDPLREELDMTPEFAQIFRGWVKQLEAAGQYSYITDLFGRLPQQTRVDISNQTRAREANPIAFNDQYIDNGLENFDNSGILFGNKSKGTRDQYATAKGIIDIDKHNHKPTYYLREIYRTMLRGVGTYLINPPAGTISGGSSPIVNPTGPKTIIDALGNTIGSSSTRSTAEQVENGDALNRLGDEENRTDSALRGKATPNHNYQKDLEKGKLEYNTGYNDEQAESAMGIGVNKTLAARDQNRKPSILERLGAGNSTLAKWARGANKSIGGVSRALQTGLDAGSQLMFDVIFGNDEGQKGFGAVTTFLITGMKTQFRKLFDFVDTKILKPIDLALFGKKGIFTKLKETELFKNIFGKLKGTKDFLSNFLLGKKITGPDGTVGRSGGLLSGIFNELNNTGKAIKNAIFGKTDKDGNRLPADKDDSVVGAFRRLGNGIAKSASDILGLDKSGKKGPETLGDLVKTGVDSVWANTKNRFTEWTNRLLGDPSKGDKIQNARDFVDSFRNDMKGNGGKVGAGAVVGAVSAPIISSSIGALGSIFLPGGPIGGAILGAGISFVNQSNTLKNFLFGAEDEDGNRTGGLISKDIINFFKEHGTGIKVGAAVGGLSGLGLLPWLWVPGGPIGGAVLGAGISMAKKSGAFDKFLYGDDGDKDNPTGGILKKFKDIFGKDKTLKQVGLDAATGAGVGLVGSFFLPGGPILGALLGSAASIAINTDKFKDLMFGKEEVDENGDKTGKRSGGLFGKFTGFMKDKVFTPFAKTAAKAQADFLYFMETKVALPLQAAVAPITNKFREFGESFMDGFKNMFSNIQKKFHDTVTKPIGEAIDKWLLKPIKNIASNIFKAFTSLLGAIISAPFAAIGGVGENIYRKDKRRGANAASTEQIKNGALGAFAAFKEKGFKGGFGDAMSSMWTGIKNASSKSVREAGAFSDAGVGRYATRENNFDTIWKEGLDKAKAARDKRYADIDAKFSGTGAGVDLGGKSKRKKPKKDTGDTAAPENKNNESPKPEEAKPVADTVFDFKKSFDEFKDKVVSNLADIRDKLVGAASSAFGKNKNNDANESGATVNGGDTVTTTSSGKSSTGKKKRGKKSKGSATVNGKSGTKVSANDTTTPSGDNSSTSGDKSSAPKATVNTGKSSKRRTGDIASNVRDIADSVHGQLNGVGLNVNKIYKVLLKLTGTSDSDITGDNNKQYVGIFGKIRTMLNRPIQAAMNLITTPFRVIGGILDGIKDTISNIWAGFKEGAKAFVKGVAQIGLSLLEIPVNITRIGVNLVKALGPAVGEFLVQSVKIIGTGLNGAAKIIFDGIGAITGVIRGAAKGFGEAIGGAISAVVTLGKGLGIVTKDIAGGIWTVLKDIVGGAWGLGKTIVGGALKGGISLVGGMLASKFNVSGTMPGLARPVYVVGGNLDKVKEIGGGTSGTVRVEGGWLDYVTENRAVSYSKSAEKSNDKIHDTLKAILDALKGGKGASASDVAEDVAGAVNPAPRIGRSSFRMNLNTFGARSTGSSGASSDFQFPMVINTGSAIAVRKRFAEEDAAKEQQESIFEVINALRVQNTENKRHYTEWNKIFSLKNGILTFGAIALFNWLTKGNFANVLYNISKKILGFLPSVLKGLFDTLGNIIAGISDKGRNKELVVDPETGLPVTDENGNVQTVKRNGMASAFMPTETQIDPKTGEAKTSLKWRSTSGTVASFVGSRVLKKALVGTASIGAKLFGDSAVNASIGSAIGSTVKNTVIGTSAALKTAGGMVMNAASKANSIPLVRNTVSPLVTSFISIATKTATFIKDKVLGFILQHGGKAGSKLLTLLDDIASIGSKLTGNSAILDSFKTKITQCMGKLSGNGSAALITGGLTELALGAFGAINANPAQVFGVNAKDVDIKMQLIARFLRGLATTTFGSVVDLVCQIINAVKNTDVVQNLAIGIYNAISNDADSEKLSKARKAFDDEWKKYQDDQYTAYLKKCQETGTTPMSEEDFKAQAAITKKSYNEQQNKTLFATVASGVGNGIRSIKNFFTGNKTGASKNGLDAYNQSLNRTNSGNDENNASGDDGGQGATVVLDKDRLNNFPFLLQNDSRWGSQQYTSTGDSSQTIGSSGCGTTSMAMILRSFGNNVTPVDTSSYSLQNGYRTANAGTGWGFFRSIGNQYGLTTEDLGKDTNAVAASLAAGKPIIASMGKGTFTKSGHFIVLSGTDSNGNILVNDPASTERSQKAWPLSVFANEGKNFWAFSKDGSGSIGNTAPVDAILSTANGSYSSNVDSANMQGENSTGSSGKKSFTQLLSEFASAIFKPIGDALGITFGDDSSSDSSNVDFNDATSTTDANGNTINYTVDGDYVGKYVKQFESGSKGSAMISSGKGDYGGVSFGSYQFPTYGQAQASSGSNLAKFWNQYYGSQYSSIPGNNDAFKKDWTTAVEKDPAGFFNNEHKFVADLYYNPFVSKLKSAGVGDPGNNSRGAQDAAWSTAVQLGAGKSAVNKFVDAGVNESTDPETYLKKLYEQKISTVPQTFKSSSKSVQQSVADRYKNELNVLLPLAKEKGINPDVVGKGETEVNGKEVTSDAMAIPTKDTISGQSFTDNISTYSSEPNASGPRSIVNYGSVRYPSYKETNAAGTSGSSGTSMDLMNQVVTLLTTIANEITNISETVEGINKKPSTIGYIDNSVTNNNNVQTATKSTPTKTYTDSAKSGRDRSGYSIAKQIAKGTFALA